MMTPAYKDANSMQLLGRVATILDDIGGRIANVDTTVMLQQPKLSPYRRQMQENLAMALGLK